MAALAQAREAVCCLELFAVCGLCGLRQRASHSNVAFAFLAFVYCVLEGRGEYFSMAAC